jgi:L-lactate utilization protein LutC
MSETHDPKDLVTQFSRQVIEVGGYIASVPNLAAVTEYVTKLASATTAKRIVVCGAKLGFGLFVSRNNLPFEVATSTSVSRTDFFKALKVAEVGISPADLGVAETGTLIIASSDESERLVTALPGIHVAVLPRSKLVYSLEDAQPYISRFLARSFEGVSISLISASSRTSDVGGIRILGVHGPKALHVLLLDQDMPGGT